MAGQKIPLLYTEIEKKISTYHEIPFWNKISYVGDCVTLKTFLSKCSLLMLAKIVPLESLSKGAIIS